MAGMVVELKVKVRSLAAEAKYIREAERQSKDDQRQYISLRKHRILDVRNEQRSTLLAYALLRGVSYERCERHCKRKPDWVRVEKIATKFGPADVNERQEHLKLVKEWLSAAMRHVNSQQEE